jgi:4-amino-4-deoxy-L-arabinose transferase-like glycosyltransferase
MTPATGWRAWLRRERGLCSVVVLALVLRWAAVAWLADTVPYSDGAYYHLAASKMVEDWRFPFDRSQVEYYGKLGWWPPLYPAFLAAVYRVAGVDSRAAAFVQVVLGALVCALVQRIGRRAAGARLGTLAALLVAIDPTYVFLTNILASENLFVVFLALALWTLGRSWNGLRAPFASGVLFGLGALTRAIGLGVPLVVVAALWRRTGDRRAWRRGAVWMLVATALTVAPWTLRNLLVTGTPALVCFGGGLNFYFGHNDVALGYRDLAQTPMANLTTQAAIDREGYRRGLAYLRQEPLRFVPNALRKVGALFAAPGYAPHANSSILLPENWQTDPERGRQAAALRARQRAKNVWLDGLFTQLATWHSWLLLAGGLLACVTGWRRLPDDLRVGAWLVAYWIVAHAVFWGQPRFRYPIEIPLALLTAWFVTRRPWRNMPANESRPAPAGRPGEPRQGPSRANAAR